MAYAKELTVSIKGDDSTYRQKFLVYEDLTMVPEDITIKECIEEAKQHYKGAVETITVRCSMKLLYGDS